MELMENVAPKIYKKYAKPDTRGRPIFMRGWKNICMELSKVPYCYTKMYWLIYNKIDLN